MSRQLSHKAVIAIAPDPFVVTDPSDGSAASMSVSSQTLASSAAVIGYTDLPEVDLGLGNAPGYGIGSARPLYKAPGDPKPTFSFPLKCGATSFLTSYCVPTAGVLPQFALFLGVGGVFTQVVRGCKVSTLGLNLSRSGEGGGGEIVANIAGWGMSSDELTTPIATPAYSTLAAYETPLLWHDVRQFTIGGTSYRRALMQLAATVNYNLVRGNSRPWWGPNNPLSGSTYEINEGNETYDCSATFDSRLPRALFNTAANSQDWGDIVVGISDVTSSNALNLTLSSCGPATEVINAKQAGAVLDYRVPIVPMGFAIS